MSGGHWEYCGFRVQAACETVARDADARRRWPLAAAACKVVGDWFYNVEHEMDWDICADSEIKDDAVFDAESFQKLLDGLRGLAPQPLTGGNGR